MLLCHSLSFSTLSTLDLINSHGIELLTFREESSSIWKLNTRSVDGRSWSKCWGDGKEHFTHLTNTHMHTLSQSISLLASVDLLSSVFDQSHPWGESLRRERAWESGFGRVWIASLIASGHENQRAAGLRICRIGASCDSQRAALPGKTVTHSGRGLRSAWRFLPPKLAQAYTSGIRSTLSFLNVCTRQIWGWVGRGGCSISLLWAYKKV